MEPPASPPPTWSLSAITACVDGMLIDYPWSDTMRAVVLRVAVDSALHSPDGWEPRFRAAWVRATAPLRDRGAVPTDINASDWALVERLVVRLLERAL